MGYRRCGDLCEIWWVIDVVAYVRYGGLWKMCGLCEMWCFMELWWLISD